MTTQLTKMAQKSEELIDEFLTYLTLSDYKSIGSKADKLPLNYFREADPTFFDGATFSSVDVGEWYSTSEKAESLGESLNYTVLTICPDKGSKFSLFRYRQVSPKEIRGRARMIMPNMLELGIGYVDLDGTYCTRKTYLGAPKNSSKWKNIDSCVHPDNSCDEHFSMNIAFVMNQQFLAHYMWRVVIEAQLGASLSFYTDPAGARAIFRLRDIPEGKTRRTMIRNWVSEHWRQYKDSPEDLIWVAKHLRGVQIFNWNGLVVKIYPPKEELKQWLEKQV